MEDRKYVVTWKKLLPVIRLHIKKSLAAEQQFKLDSIAFEQAGGRNKSGYSFLLQLEDGKAVNNISGSAVARDLLEVLKSDEPTKAMLMGRSIKISVGSTFMLSIKNTHISKFK